MRIDTKFVLQHLHNRRGTQCRQIPIVSDIGAADRHIVRVALHKHTVVLVVLDNLGNLVKNVHRLGRDFITTRLEEHIVGQRDIDHPFQDLHIDILKLRGVERTGKIVGKHHQQRVAL